MCVRADQKTPFKEKNEKRVSPLSQQSQRSRLPHNNNGIMRVITRERREEERTEKTKNKRCKKKDKQEQRKEEI
jgi:hypothetical protein